MKRSGLPAAKLYKAIRAMPCWGCGSWPSDSCHVRSRGAGGPNEDFNIIPLCRACHRLQHTDSWRVFWKPSLTYGNVYKLWVGSSLGLNCGMRS